MAIGVWLLEWSLGCGHLGCGHWGVVIGVWSLEMTGMTTTHITSNGCVCVGCVCVCVCVCV